MGREYEDPARHPPPEHEADSRPTEADRRSHQGHGSVCEQTVPALSEAFTDPAHVRPDDEGSRRRDHDDLQDLHASKIGIGDTRLSSQPGAGGAILG
jgi:hypothetical protein